MPLIDVLCSLVARISAILENSLKIRSYIKFDQVFSPNPILIIILLVSIFLAQIFSAALAARYTGNFKLHESMMIGFGMLGRAELAFVVMDIAYVQNSIFTTEVFYMLMFTTFWLNVSVPITITLWKPYYMRGEEVRKSVERASIS